MLKRFLRIIAFLLGIAMVGGTLLNTLRSTHWFIRGWDFPRLHIAWIATLSALLIGFTERKLSQLSRLFLAATGLTAAWQFWKIRPYTRLARKEIHSVAHCEKGDSVRLVVSNVLQTNTRHALWLETVTAPDPDIILALETDQRWIDAVASLEHSYPHTVFHPLDNYYGIALYSRLPLHDTELRFIVQDDIPSIHTHVKMPSGRRIALRCLHPRPPEPMRDQDSLARDAELVLVVREIDEDGTPTIVLGDLNDVAWSHTTRRFRRLSGLLDPRIGRGFYNTYNAEVAIFRWPLDHVFVSKEFELVTLELLDYVGSDHFPVLVELRHTGDGNGQSEPDEEPEDEEEAEELVEEAEEKPELRAGGDGT